MSMGNGRLAIVANPGGHLLEEERYASQMNLNQQRAMHCSFMENQKLLELKNEEKLFSMQLKASKAVMSKLDTKQRNIERTLQGLKESLYAICYQLETTGARVAHMEGAQAERECSAELAEQENSRLKTSMLNVSGGEKEVSASREEWRRLRVEEALTRLRVAHATRALAGLDRTHYTLDERRLQLDAAMKERLVEISARRDMFGVQKRALVEECGKLRGEIREREQRVHQLIKRHDIFIASLGKDESGQQLSVTFFKIKFAAERAELRERGAQLDAEIVKRERDVSALEATMRVVHAAHAHFMRQNAPLDQDGPEITELNDLTKQYYERRDTLKQVQAQVARLEEQVADAGAHLTTLADKYKQLTARQRDTLKQVQAQVARLEEQVADAGAHLTTLADKYKQLTARQSEAENQLESLKEHAQRQENRLQNAHDVIGLNLKRAKKLFDDVDEWRIFKLSMYNRNYAEAAHTALQSVHEACAGVRGARAQLAVLLCGEDVRRNLPRHNMRLHSYVDRIIASESAASLRTSPVLEESVFSESLKSSRSGVSMASGYTKRLSAFRRTLAPKVGEQSVSTHSYIYHMFL
ncbi:Coiled-coil domain-containing protein 39 [Papilio machaon]|uniref:Coiled-coil domain-containing protein 39 n=1 Tax=Papilio machaon TaxID=76193 RepID=A0A194R7C0_PAPMA|nr:Coiled-coil domain-containing protein 39 [Papilio machaon]